MVIQEEQQGSSDKIPEAFSPASSGLLETSAPLSDANESQRHNLKEVLSLLERELKGAKDDCARAEHLSAMGRLYEESIGQSDQALFHYKRALDREAQNEKALDGMTRILTLQGRWAELEEILKSAICSSGDRMRTSRLEFHLATLYLDHLSKKEQGIRALVRVLEVDPLNRAVYPLLDQLYREKGDWPAVLANLSAWLDITQDKATAVRIMNQTAEIWFKHAQKPEKSRQILEDLLALDPENVQALRNLENLYRMGECWSELVQILERQASLLSFRHPDEQSRIGLALADIYSSNIVDHARAESYLQKVVQLDPLNPKARETLIKIHESKANWVEVLEVYRADLEHIRDDKLRAQRLLRIAEITEEHLGKKEESTEIFREAYRTLHQIPIVPGREEAKLREILAAHMVRRWQSEGRLDDLKNYYEGLTQTSPLTLWVQEKTNVLKVIIELCDRDEIPFYCKDLRTLAEHVEDAEQKKALQIFALKELANAHLGQEQWQKLVEVYQQLLSLFDESHEYATEKAMIYFRLGEIQNYKLGLKDQAAYSYEKALHYNSQLAPALRARREIFIGQGKYNEALSLFQMEISLTSSERARSALYLQMGILREDHLRQTELAVRDYEHALNLDPENQGVLKRLGVHYYHAEQWEKAEPVFAKMAHLMSRSGVEGGTPLKKAAFWTRRAKILEQLGNLETAIDYLHRAMEMSPSFVPAMEHLAGLYQRTHQWAEAKRYFQNLLRYIDKSPPREGDQVSPLYRVFLNLAQIEERLENIPEAKLFYQKALEVDDRQVVVLQSLINIESQAGDWVQVQNYYDRILQVTTEPENWITVQFAKAEIWENQIQKPKNAIACYKAVLEKDPLNTLALERLAQLYCTTGAFEQGIEILQKLLVGETESQRCIQYLLSLGRVYRSGLGNLKAAEEQYRQILLMDSKNIPVLKELVEIYRDLESWQELANTYSKIIDLVAQSDVLLTIPFYLKLGTLYRTRLNEPNRAIAAFRHVVDVDEDNVGARNALIEIYSTHESFHDEALRQHRKLLHQDPLKINSYRALAQIYYQRRDFDRAFCLYSILDALGETPEDERNFVLKCRSAHHSKLRSQIPDSLRREVLMDSGEQNILTDVVNVLQMPLRELFWKAKKDDPFDEPLGTFARQMMECVQEVSPVINIPTPEIRISKSSKEIIEPFGGVEPTLIIHNGFLRGTFNSEKRFRFIRVLDSLVGGRDLAVRLGAANIQKLFVVIMKFFYKELPVEGYPEKELKSDIKQFKKVFPRKMRDPIRDLVGQLAREWEKIDVPVWVEGVHRTGNRVALLLDGDFEAALTVLLKDEGIEDTLTKKESAGLNRLGLVARSARLRDLLIFASSEDFFRLRARIGRAIPAGMLQF